MSRRIGASVPLCLAQSCCSFWVGIVVLFRFFLRMEKLGLLGGLRPLLDVMLQWGYMCVMVEARRFGFTMIFSAI